MERVLELVGVASNKNTVPGDISAMKSGGLRMGSPAMTTRGLRPEDFVRIADIVDRAVTISLDLDQKAITDAESQKIKHPRSLKAFFEFLGDGNEIREIVELRQEVEKWIGTFSLPWEK